ncbi:hypothetical protein M9Y10_021824 [Tritrichomonas musculus]|uniref:Uncharacterized protein n=1 Tax=Tritrichomonas musculus TaxID=1915356 RepID=A0ABR2KQS2_9EUKA
MKIHGYHDYKKNFSNEESSNNNQEDEILQLFNDAVDDIYNSIEIQDEDLLSDSILHMTRLLRDDKNRNEFNKCLDTIDALKTILSKLLIFDFDSSLSKSTLEMISFLSSTNLLQKTEILYQEQYFLYIVNSAIMTKNPYSFIILSNFSLECERNAQKCLVFILPHNILNIFYQSAEDDSNQFDTTIQKQKEFYLLSVLSLLSSYCNYNVDENLAFEILSCIKDLIFINQNNTTLLTELFYALSRFRLSCQCCIRIANQINLFECFEKVRFELNPKFIVTIFQYYGDSIMQEYEIPELNIDKLINYASNNNKIISGTAIWLIWTYLNGNSKKSIQKFYTSQFFDLIKSVIIENERISNTENAILVLCILIEKADSTQIEFCATDEIINLIFDFEFIEYDDQQIVFHTILALNRILDYMSVKANYNFYNFLKSKLKESSHCELDDEYSQILIEKCSDIMNCFDE